MEESKKYKWVNLRVESDFHERLKACADRDFLPIATFAKQVLSNEVRNLEKNIKPDYPK